MYMTWILKKILKYKLALQNTFKTFWKISFSDDHLYFYFTFRFFYECIQLRLNLTFMYNF